jgi:hypothetical protein
MDHYLQKKETVPMKSSFWYLAVSSVKYNRSISLRGLYLARLMSYFTETVQTHTKHVGTVTFWNWTKLYLCKFLMNFKIFVKTSTRWWLKEREIGLKKYSKHVLEKRCKSSLMSLTN